MDTNLLTVWLASAGALAGLMSVGIALFAGLRYGAAEQRMPAAARLEDVVARLAVKQEELERVEAQFDNRQDEMRSRLAEFEAIAARRDAADARLRELQEDLAGLEGRRAEIELVRNHLAEGRTQLAELQREIAERRAEHEQIQFDAERARVQLARLDERKAEIETINAAEREARTRLIDVQGELDTARRQLYESHREAEQYANEQEVLRTEVNRLEVERRALEPKVDALRHEVQNTQAQLDTASGQLSLVEGTLQIKHQELAQLATEHQNLTVSVSSIRREIETLETCLPELHREVADKEAALNAIHDKTAQAQSALEQLQREREPLFADIAAVRHQIVDARTQLKEFHTELINQQASLVMTKHDLETSQSQLDTARKELVRLRVEITPLADEAMRAKLELNNRREELQNLDTEMDHKRAALAAIEREIQVKGGGHSGAEPENALADLVRPPACLIEQRDGQTTLVLPKPQLEISEGEALDRARQYLTTLGLRFPERTLYAFHTALKIATISPLTVLAGISGTGKSQLPRRYAEAMGLHFLKIPVQPGWDSPQDMLGFYNYLEKRYKATEFARALVYFDPHNWADLAEKFKDHLLLVLLDEMNLARVEYYFSEFLSQLEGRPAPGNINRDHISKSEIILDIGGAGGQSRRIYPGHNLLFVGTMNEDESTQTLSDKVLDRANLLRFSRPAKLVNEPPDEQENQTRPVQNYFPAQRWHGWRRRFGELPNDLQERVTGWIDRLNNDLGELHRPFAHRVNQAILAYIANYPGVATATHGNGLEPARIAFADQLEQRILPKLRGVDLGDSTINLHLRHIEEMIRDELHDEDLAKAFHRAADDDGSGRPFMWMGVRREDAS